MNKRQRHQIEALRAVLDRRAKPEPPMEVGKDPVEMFELRPLGVNVRLLCKYDGCEYWAPFVAGVTVDKVCQELYSHAYTNHGVRPT